MSCPTCLEHRTHRHGCPEGLEATDPIECDGTCRCDGTNLCVWFVAEERCGYPIGDGDVEACERCEGDGEYVPEVEEDAPEPDEPDEDWREDR